jgi:type II secretory pathway pseudopilin PulG
MLVTIVVVALLGAAVTITVQSMTHHTIATRSRDNATDQAQLTMDRASRLLRAATPEGAGNTIFTLADNNHATFYSDLAQPNGPAKVDLSVAGGTLVSAITPADAASNYTYNGAATTQQNGADITSSASLFTYYDANGNQLSTPMTTVAQTSLIAQVRITVVDREAGGTVPVTDSTLIYLRNVEYS